MVRLYILSGLIAGEDEPDLLPLLGRVPGIGRARIRRLDLPTDAMPPHALWLGLEPGEGEMAPGPLRVAALGWDPPERSTHFCLDALAFQEGALAPVTPPAESRTLLAPLATRGFTMLAGGEGRDALVWEDLGDFLTLSPEEATGKTLTEAMPDGEPWLRRFIDDSANLLLDSEMNRRRVGDGLPPISFAWPWGAGPRLPVPSMPLRIGKPLTLVGGDDSTRGLARLAGFGKRGEAEIVVLSIPAFEDPEERERHVAEALSSELERILDDPTAPVAIVLPDAWNPTQGLWLSRLPGMDGEGELRREMLGERKVPALRLPRAIPTFLALE